MSTRRDRHDLVMEILKTAREGKIKTHIMYKAKLSYSQINTYLDMLTDKGFLEKKDVKGDKRAQTIYKTTPKGINLVENIEVVNTILGEAKDDVSDSSGGGYMGEFY